MMSWNYRILRYPDEGYGETYEIVEAYFDTPEHVTGWCEATVTSDSLEGLREVYDMMVEAFDKPVFDLPVENSPVVIPMPLEAPATV